MKGRKRLDRFAEGNAGPVIQKESHLLTQMNQMLWRFTGKRSIVIPISERRMFRSSFGVGESNIEKPFALAKIKSRACGDLVKEETIAGVIA
jgi:hypothetical protein